MVLLATLAAIIASQATITGAFSVTRQAVQLDLLPRLRILQTSAHEHGQIFVPVVNCVGVLIAVCIFVVGFGSSDALGSAYGAAVAGTMFITTLLGMQLAISQWRWQRWQVAGVFGPLLLRRFHLRCRQPYKVCAGRLGAAVIRHLALWRVHDLAFRPPTVAHAALRAVAVPLKDLPKLLDTATRVPGTAVFLVSDPLYVPTALLRNLEHNHVAHERIVFLNMEFVRTPRQDPNDRVRIDTLLENVHLVTARFGFMETPDVSAALKQCRVRGLKLFGQDCSFFLGWHLVRPRPRGGYEGMRRRPVCLDAAAQHPGGGVLPHAGAGA